MAGFLRRVAALLVASAALVGAYLALFQPWLAEWGATRAEVEQQLPGDELWPVPARIETRAVTVHAPIQRTWPWLAQLGRGRGGFYSYECLENLVGADIHNAGRLLPGLRAPAVGDTLWMAPPDRFEGSGFAWYSVVVPGRAFVVTTHVGDDPTPVGTWAFVLEPRGAGETRFLVRGRSGRPGGGPPRLAGLFERLVFVPMHFVMERRMMLGLAERAEGRPLRPGVDVAEAATWMVALAVLVVAAALTLARRRWGRPFVLFAGAGLGLLLLPLLHPPLAMSVPAAGLLVAGLPWSLRARGA